ncbi:MAG: tRNA lysidine(34) synthetase TilS [Candidatus Moranbacteria bacterium]|nr:tRNA lysidine(34) synthetase TilS [Candidatus Moranbacteria bacterium]
MPNLIKKFQNISRQHSLWQKGSKIVLGVSGGPDSVCMLDIFASLQKKYALELIIAHVNYGLRGKDSDGDEKFVRKLGVKYGIGIEVLNCKSLTPSPSPKGRGGHFSENALREIRYTFFEKIRRENDFDSIAVAHNSDDQVETFLMRLIRGSGLVGLSAMKFKTGKIIRPLLGIYRKEILEHLDKTHRTYRTDRTNKTAVFFRNKVRHQLIPQLEKLNPNIKQTIFDATQSIAMENDFIEKSIKKIPKDLSVQKILSLHPAIQRRIILKKIQAIRGSLKDISIANVAEILKALKSTKGKSQIVVFKGLKLTRRGDKVIIKRL